MRLRSDKGRLRSDSLRSDTFAKWPVFFATLPIIVSSSSTLHWKVKRVCNGILLAGNLDHRHWRQEVRLSDWFAVLGGEIITSWRCASCLRNFMTWNIWFWGENNHFERNYRVYKFGRFSSNFAKTFRELWQTKVCREIIRHGVSIYAKRITKRVRHVYVDWCLVIRL